MRRTLAINPGSTSTKIAVYEDEAPLFTEVLNHNPADIAAHPHVADQYEFRRSAVLSALERHGVSIASLHAVVGRGGLLRRIESGTYEVNARMLDDLRQPGEREHAANLGALLAHEIATLAGVSAYIVDPISVDEFEPIARISGLPGNRAQGPLTQPERQGRGATRRQGPGPALSRAEPGHGSSGGRHLRVSHAPRPHRLTPTRRWMAPAPSAQSEPAGCPSATWRACAISANTPTRIVQEDHPPGRPGGAPGHQ